MTTEASLPESFRNHFQERGIPEYSLDGPIDEQQWKHGTFRMLFLLKETYGYQGCGVFWCADEAHRWLDDGIKTYKKIALLAAAIIESVNQGNPISSTEVDALADNSEKLHDALDKIAVINIKKHSGESTSSDPQIREESVANAKLLRDQICSLKPHLIVTGGNVCWVSLTDDLEIFESAPSCEKLSVTNHEGVLLCRANHPSAWSGGGFPVAELHQRIAEAALHRART